MNVKASRLWRGAAPSPGHAVWGGVQGALLCWLAHVVIAVLVLTGKAAYGARVPSPADFVLAAGAVAISSALWAAVIGAPLLLVLGRLGVAGALTYALCGGAQGAGLAVFASWKRVPLDPGFVAFMTWYGSASAATAWARVRTLAARAAI